MKASVSPAYESDSNGVGNAISQFEEFVDVESDTHGFKANPAAVMIKKITITEAMLPSSTELLKTANIPDKHCIVFILTSNN